MERLVCKKGMILHNFSDTASHLEYIVSGSVQILSSSLNVTAKQNAVLGLFEHPNENYMHRYVVLSDTVIERIPYTRRSDMDQIVRQHSDESDKIVTAIAALTLSVLSRYNNIRKRTDAFRKLLDSSYKEYHRICESYAQEIQSCPFLDVLDVFQPEKELPDWLGDYYDQLGQMPDDVRHSFYGTHSSLATATILEAAAHTDLLITLMGQLFDYLNEMREAYKSHADLFDLYLNLYNRSRDTNTLDNSLYSVIKEAAQTLQTQMLKGGILPENLIHEHFDRYDEAIQNGVSAGGEGSGDTAPDANDPYTELRDSLEQILRYTSLDDAEEERFRSLVYAYRSLKDKNSSEDDARKLRKDIAKNFFDIYENAIVTAMESGKEPPLAVRLFLYFGYMDEVLLGRENTIQLCRLLKKVEAMKVSSSSHHEFPAAEAELENAAEEEDERHVYTIYDWLAAIYYEEKEPSRNEYDQDYPAFLRTQKQGGFITDEQEKRYLKSPREKLRFELNNFFKLSMRIASGRPSVFCPLLSEHNIIRNLKEVLVTAEKVMENWDQIRSVDYSIFYREALYQQPDYRIARETILIEALPDMVLLPVIGTRGGMWQEITGARRDTPGRMYLPIFCNEDISTLQLKLAGEFRWQLCKRIQGARWNDISDKNLTAEYFEYLQFYRKNPDLSSDAREKVKTEIQACRNSFENVFVVDYIQWIRFESQGAPRLNKVAKRILFTYCPFAKDVCNRLASHPLYSEFVGRHQAKSAKQLKLLEGRYRKVREEYGDLPQEIEAYINYYAL